MDRQKDNLKWFGEGFDGFPRSLPEDCVEYTLYVIDSRLNDFDVREKLREVQTEANRLTKKLLGNFIWQRESFTLNLVRKNDKLPGFLHGRTNYGDSVEDEWLVVYLLRELSRRFPKLWIRVVDTDGQFLLIEAANALPQWLNPEIADFRIWINDGNLKIIPIIPMKETRKVKSMRPLQEMTIEDALNILRNELSKLLHSPSIEAEAFYRLQKYPKQITDTLHHALIQIPRKLAYILHEEAAFISPAIEAFYLRDPIATRLLYASDATNAVFAPTDLVTVSVKFTKVGYAQVKSQRFAAPPAWSGILSTAQGKSFDRLDLGMKVTSGFEMLLSDSQNKDLKAVREINLLLEDIETGDDRLPSDSDIAKWKTNDDDETWLDVDFEQFERELAGKGSENLSASPEGFGDKAAQGNLRKMVERFEDFLKDEEATAEGAEYLDDMDKDNDDDDDDDDDHDDDCSDDSSKTEGDENKEVIFDADEFATLMRNMMGGPEGKGPYKSHTKERQGAETNDAPADVDEENEIRRVMSDMESELREAGALRLDVAPTAGTINSPKQPDDAGARGFDRPTNGADRESDTDEDLDIDYNLAKNMLESFKSQDGGAGPGGNLLGLMGIHLSRDEGDSSSTLRRR